MIDYNVNRRHSALGGKCRSPLPKPGAPRTRNKNDSHSDWISYRSPALRPPLEADTPPSLSRPPSDTRHHRPRTRGLHRGSASLESSPTFITNSRDPGTKKI